MPVGEKLYRADNGRDLRFYYDFDALVAVEEAAGRSFKAVLEDMARGETLLKDLRALIWAGLQKHQPEITLSQAGELVLTEGQQLGESMREALVAAMPELKADSPKKGDRDGGNPPQTRGGGKSSSRTGAKRGSSRAASGS
jgi:hypothetical protein